MKFLPKNLKNDDGLMSPQNEKSHMIGDIMLDQVIHSGDPNTNTLSANSINDTAGPTKA
jgi:hypothetical protein